MLSRWPDRNGIHKDPHGLTGGSEFGFCAVPTSAYHIGAIMMQNHTLSVDGFRPFILYFVLEYHQLLAEDVRIMVFSRRAHRRATTPKVRTVQHGVANSFVILEQPLRDQDDLKKKERDKNDDVRSIISRYKTWRSSLYVHTGGVTEQLRVLPYRILGMDKDTCCPAEVKKTKNKEYFVSNISMSI
ncbi:hypothetical protein EVAR_98492_1 [Eumeta japonica]|uniref:Uncharacterized protein n=1 Tax=Eumeta variegata TaxID=151549 RepID=A0A4C1YJW5_EUMVA|nr:hypothetical protein EVAR_98492_1 [Eumeta japonica]